MSRLIKYIVAATFALCGIKADASELMLAQDSVADILSGGDFSPFDEKVIVGNDTVSVVIDEKNYGRYDRGLLNYLYIPKGDWTFGLSASYGEFNADDVRILSILKDFDFGGEMYSVKPSVSYFFKNNQSAGVRFNYTRGKADINSLVVDFDEDLNFSLKDVSYDSKAYGISLFYRRYIGLDRSKRFALFNETNLAYSGGSQQFKRYYNNELSDTRTTVNEVSLNFCPGVNVFVHEYVSFNLSFGVFGIYYRNEKQKTNEIYEGSRSTSGASFKFNVFNINLGLGIHI